MNTDKAQNKTLDLYCGFCDEHYPAIPKEEVLNKTCKNCGHNLSILRERNWLDSKFVKTILWSLVILGILLGTLWATYDALSTRFWPEKFIETSQYESHIEKAKELFYDHPAEAISEIDKAIALEPDKTEGYELKSLYLFYDDNYSAALLTAIAGLGKGETATLYKIKGNILFKLGRCKEATTDMKKEIALDPTDQILTGGLDSAEYIISQCQSGPK